MTASQLAKRMGLKSLKEVSEHVHKPSATLINWHRDNPDLFYIVCLGVGTKLISQEKSDDL